MQTLTARGASRPIALPSSSATRPQIRSWAVRSFGELAGALSQRPPLAGQQLRPPAHLQRNHRLNVAANAAAAAAGGWAGDGSSGSSEQQQQAATPPVQRHSIPTWLAAVRATFFYVTTFLFAVPGFSLMLLIAPLVLWLDKYRRRAEHAVNNVWAKVSTLFYYPIEIEGRENLPPADQPAVYVANHLSFLDIYTLFHLDRDFKFISKTSNFLIPLIGWSMFLTGHVMINRVDRRSQLECLKQCGELLKKGASVLFFPEGTRSKDGRMYEFKKGAFSVAAKAGVPVVPVTLIGTGDLMPNKKEYLLYPGRVKMVVHPPIQPGNADAMTAAAREAIASSLPPELVVPV